MSNHVDLGARSQVTCATYGNANVDDTVGCNQAVRYFVARGVTGLP
jgi:hypothetical protein